MVGGQLQLTPLLKKARSASCVHIKVGVMSCTFVCFGLFLFICSGVPFVLCVTSCFRPGSHSFLMISPSVSEALLSDVCYRLTVTARLHLLSGPFPTLVFTMIMTFINKLRNIIY